MGKAKWADRNEKTRPSFGEDRAKENDSGEESTEL